MQIRKELWLRPHGESGDQYWMLHSPFILKSNEKKEVLETIKSMCLPSNYVGPIHKQIQDGQLWYLKSHNFHTLIQQVSYLEHFVILCPMYGNELGFLIHCVDGSVYH